MDPTAIFALFSVFFVAPTIVFGFIYLSKRSKLKLDELRLKKEILELEVEKERAHTRALEAESAKYDRMIESR
jgi:uncharacterized membrane protein YciS (DUF1049 family)